MSNLRTVLLFSISLLLTCQSEKKDNAQSISVEDTTAIKSPENSETMVEIKTDSIQLSKTKSELKKKAERLSELKVNYQIKKLKKIDFWESTLFRRLKMVLEREGIGKEYSIKNFDNLDTLVFETNSCDVKGTKDFGGKLFAQARIEEFIFKSAKEAKGLFDSLSKMEKNARFWMHVDKAPNSLFIEENKMYFISTGGHYMLDIYEEIEAKMRK